MPWGFVIGGIASLVGGAISASGSSDAASAQASAANQASQVQQNEFNTILGLETPGRNLGYGADQLLAQLFGIPDPTSASTSGLYSANAASPTLTGTAFDPTLYGGAAPTTPGAPGAPAAGPAGTANYSNFYNSPGYQFALQQGQQAIERGASANGSLYSTNTLGALNTFAQGQAATRYNDYVQQLLALAGIGGQATAGTTAAATSVGNNIAANTLSAGNANASGILGQAGAFSSAVGNVPFQSLFGSSGANGLTAQQNSSLNGYVSGAANGFNFNIPTTDYNNYGTGP